MIHAAGFGCTAPDGRWLLRDIDLRVARGEALGLAGASGAGKSLLACHLAGIQRWTCATTCHGTLSIGGRDARAGGLGLAGAVLQDPQLQLVAETVGEELALGPQASGRSAAQVDEAVADSAQALGIDGILDRALGECSLGQRQRVALAAMLAQRPALLVLDEPSAYLDEDGVACLVRALDRSRAEHGLTLILAEHDRDLRQRLCPRTIHLAGGRMVEEPPPPPPPTRREPADGGEVRLRCDDVSVAGPDRQRAWRASI